MNNFFRNNSFPGMGILISKFNCNGVQSADELKQYFEHDICDSLELYESTKYYKDRITFIYEQDHIDDDSGKRQVSGVLENDRLGTTVYFYGYYLDNPIAYIFGICDEEEHMEQLVDAIEIVLSTGFLEDESRV